MPQQQQTQQQMREEQYWRQVRMTQYRTLGNRIAALEALERGMDPVASEDMVRTPGAEVLLVGERQACLKAQIRMVLRALQASLQAVLDTRPQIGEECELVEVRRICGDWHDGAEGERDSRN